MKDECKTDSKCFLKLKTPKECQQKIELELNGKKFWYCKKEYELQKKFNGWKTYRDFRLT